MTSKELIEAGGGAAFPGVAHFSGAEHSEGMSLRDWFAGQALPAVIADASAGGRPEGVGTVYDMLSQSAYRFADAMIAERARGTAS